MGGLEFTGYSYDEIVGEAITKIAVDPDVIGDIIDVVNRDEAWTGDFKLRTKDGAAVFGQGSAAPVFVDGEKRGYMAVFIDTTKQRRFENASEVLNRLLRHDLRNEMNVLYGYVQQAQDQEIDDEASEYLEVVKRKITEIIRKSERARELRGLLDRSYEAANRPIRLDYALNDGIVEVLDRYDDAEFRFQPFPDVRVVGDDLLSTAIQTILENAVDHNDSDVPVVRVSVDIDPEEVVISVSDNGPGVPAGQEDVIFGREEIDPLHHGSGISLFFADSVINSYNGDIWVEDNDHGGATFKVRLPRARNHEQ